MGNLGQFPQGKPTVTAVHTYYQPGPINPKHWWNLYRIYPFLTFTLCFSLAHRTWAWCFISREEPRTYAEPTILSLKAREVVTAQTGIRTCNISVLSPQNYKHLVP